MAYQQSQKIVAEIAERQDEVLLRLDELNREIEKTIEEFAPKLNVVSPAA